MYFLSLSAICTEKKCFSFTIFTQNWWPLAADITKFRKYVSLPLKIIHTKYGQGWPSTDGLEEKAENVQMLTTNTWQHMKAGSNMSPEWSKGTKNYLETITESWLMETNWASFMYSPEML